MGRVKSKKEKKQKGKKIFVMRFVEAKDLLISFFF